MRRLRVTAGGSMLLGVTVLSAALAVHLAARQPAGAGQPTLPLGKIALPPGFGIEIYASGVENARSMALSPSGTLFVGTREKGSVYAVVDTNHDHKADRVYTIAKGLTMPNGVAFRDGSLFVAEVSRITRYDAIEQHLETPPAPAVVNDHFPDARHHGWKFIAFGPDGLLYVPVGAPCNVCEPWDRDQRFASITRMKPDGTGLEIVATGIRNSVGFDWQPGTNELWFTDNGRDELGDDAPSCELNRVSAPGQHFGFPYCHTAIQKNAGDPVTTFADPEFGKKRSCDQFVTAAQALGPHVAPLGMRFYTGSMFPATYKGAIIVAEHGSWNRSKKSGYRLAVVHVDGSRVVSHEPFATGWLQGEEAWGRPVDVLQMPDGALLVSDDQAGVIYRVSFTGT